METKFKPNDRCRVIQDMFEPEHIGYIVTIIDIFKVYGDGTALYKIECDDGVEGYASESCLELLN